MSVKRGEKRMEYNDIEREWAKNKKWEYLYIYIYMVCTVKLFSEYEHIAPTNIAR